MAPSEADLNAGVVVGVGALNNDEVRPRVDIDVMISKQPDVFNLFLLALIDLQADSSKLGYFALAGIHGLPTTLWDGVGKDFPETNGGYCAHGRLLFPTWHRPYLALLEQTIYRKMLGIVKEYDHSIQPRYRAAARAFRFPYWDYFRPRDVDAKFPGITLEGNRTRYSYDFRMPDVFNVTEVMIRMPPHDRMEVRRNPLYNFKFTDKLNLDRDWSRAKLNNFNPDRTVRCPRDKKSKYHNVQELSDSLNSGREGRAAMMLDILNPNSSRYPDLQDVASDMVLRGGDLTNTKLTRTISGVPGSKAASYGSIEGLHGNYHTIIGGSNGHMSHPSIAAFDPIFWFHHCNVDRIFAIWQATHPNAWFPPAGRDSRGRPLKAENEKDLLPFYKVKNEMGPIFYDSDWARDTESFGYTYPDLEGLRDPRAVWRSVYNKYIWSIRSASSSRFSPPPSDMKPINLNKAQVFQYPGANSRGGAPDTHESYESHDTTVRIVYRRVLSSSSDTSTTSQVSIQSYSSAPAPDNDIDPYFDRTWYIDNIVKRNVLNGPFTVYFFLCLKSRFPDDPDDYATSPYLAGINHIFAAPREVCDNCGRQDAAGVLASDTVPITPLLLDYVAIGVLDSMRAEHVHPFLVKYLRWRVVYDGSSRADPRELPHFEVMVSARISHEDGSTTYASYPDIVEDIYYNAASAAY